MFSYIPAIVAQYEMGQKNIKIDIIKSIMEKIEGSVILDGLILDRDIKINDDLTKEDLLEAFCKAMDCTWQEFPDGIYISRIFEREREFPIISINEIKSLIYKMNTLIRKKSVVTDKKNTTEIFQSILPILSKKQKIMLDAENQGLPVREMNSYQKQIVLQAARFSLYNTASMQWEELEAVLRGIESAKLSLKETRGGSKTLGCTLNGRKFLFPVSNDHSELSDVEKYKKIITANENYQSVFKNIEGHSVVISEEVKNHFVSYMGVKKPKESLRLLSKMNNWNFSFDEQSNAKNIRIAVRKSGELNDILPLEYINYYLGVNLDDHSRIRNRIRQKSQKLNHEYAIYSKLVVEMFTNRDETENLKPFEKELILRFALSYTMCQTMREIVTNEVFPPEYLTDYENAILYRKQNGEQFSLIHPVSSLNVRVRRFSVPLKQ